MAGRKRRTIPRIIASNFLHETRLLFNHLTLVKLFSRQNESMKLDSSNGWQQVIVLRKSKQLQQRFWLPCLYYDWQSPYGFLLNDMVSSADWSMEITMTEDMPYLVDGNLLEILIQSLLKEWRPANVKLDSSHSLLERNESKPGRRRHRKSKPQN